MGGAIVGGVFVRSRQSKAAPAETKVLYLQPSRLVGTPSATSMVPAAPALVGLNEKSGKYHRQGCAYLKGRLRMMTEDEAQRRGAEACISCPPPAATLVVAPAAAGPMVVEVKCPLCGVANLLEPKRLKQETKCSGCGMYLPDEKTLSS